MKNDTIIKRFFKKIEGGKESSALGLYLISKLEELLKNLELIEWAIDESPDVAETFWDYKNNKLSERFSKYFTLLEDIEDVQEGFEVLKRNNLNIYFVTLMSLYESFLNFIIRLLSKNSANLNLPWKPPISRKSYKYFLDEEKDLSLKIDDRTPIKIELSKINQKLWCFHNLLNTKKPKPHRFLNKSDFEYYWKIRNSIIHGDEEIVNLELLPIYNEMKEEIFTKDNKVSISKYFFYTALENIFDFCHEVSISYEKRIGNNKIV